MLSINDLITDATHLNLEADAFLMGRLDFRDRIIACYCQRIAQLVSSTCLNATLDEAQLLDALQNLLIENWDLIQGTALSYTALANNLATQLLANIAIFIAEKKLILSPESPLIPLALLMPGLSLDSLNDELYPHIDAATNIPYILHTSIYSRCALLPVRLLTSLDNKVIYNPYYDYHKADQMADQLSAEELDRLRQHSNLAAEVLEAKKYYDLLLSDTSHLLGHLNQLCRDLYLNNAYGGVGTHDNAGAGAYPAILSFSMYYTCLTTEDIARIPEPVKVEIDKLLQLSSDPKVNINATQQIETCIANRRHDLLQAMDAHESSLSRIGTMSSDRKADLLAHAKADFIAAKDRLKAALDRAVVKINSYKGCEKLGLTKGLIDALGIHLSFNSLQDIDCLKELDAADITCVMADEGLRGQFFEQITLMDDLVLLARELSLHQLRALFNILSTQLKAEINTDEAQIALLRTFDPERCRVICDALTLSIETPEKFIEFVQALSPHQMGVIFYAGIPHDRDKIQKLSRWLSEHIKNKVMIVQLLTRLPSQYALDAIKMPQEHDGITSTPLMQAAEDVETCLMFIDSLSTEDRQGLHFSDFFHAQHQIEKINLDLILQLLERLPLFIKTIEDLSLFVSLWYFHRNGDHRLPPRIDERLLSIVCTTSDLINCIDSLEGFRPTFKSVLERDDHFKEQVEFIASIDFVYIMFKIMGEKRFNELLNNIEGVSVVLQYTKNPELLHAYKQKMSSLTQTENDFNQLHQCLSSRKILRTISYLEPSQIGQIIQRCGQLNIFIQYYSYAQWTRGNAIYQTIFAYLTSEQKSEALALWLKLSGSSSINGFLVILSALTPNDRSLLLSTPFMVNTILHQRLEIYQLDKIVSYFSPEEQRNYLYFALFRKALRIFRHHRLGYYDPLIYEYFVETINRIRWPLDEDSLHELDRNLSATLNSVTSLQLKAVEQYVDELRKRARQCIGFFYPGSNKKALQIVAALLRVPPQLRGSVLSRPFESNLVLQAIARIEGSEKWNRTALARVHKIHAQLRAADPELAMDRVRP